MFSGNDNDGPNIANKTIKDGIEIAIKAEWANNIININRSIVE